MLTGYKENSAQRKIVSRAQICFAFLTLSLFTAGCGGSNRAVEYPRRGVYVIHKIESQSDFPHPKAGVSFPLRFGEFTRVRLTGYDSYDNDISATYGAEKPAGKQVITAYVYPAGQATSTRLLQEFISSKRSVLALNPGAKQRATAIIHPTGTPAGVAGFQARWDAVAKSNGGVEMRLSEHLRLFQCGAWFLKFRATSPEALAANTEEQITAFENYFSCSKLANNFPLGTKLTIVLDSNMKSEQEAVWLAYAMDLVVWLQKKVTPAELAYGVPDHLYEMFRKALTDALSIRADLAAKSALPPDAFFDGLAAAQQAGYFNEYIWDYFLGFLEPDPELKLDLAAFEKWRSENAQNLGGPMRGTVAIGN